MLRVLHVICDLAGGGAERLVLDLCRFHGPDVAPSVMTVHPGGALTAAFAEAGVQTRSAGRWRRGPGGLALARLVAAARASDVVHTHLWAGDTWGGLAAILAGVPWVRTEHNTDADGPFRARITALQARAAVLEVCVSQAAARRVPGARVIYNGVDLSRFRARAPRDQAPRRVLGLGRLTRQKGFDVLCEAARRAQLSVDLVGEGEEAEALAAAGATLRGWTPDVAGALAEADLVAIPSRWEGFGLVAVEAMASGVPVVASEVPGLSEVVGDAGLLVPPDDASALAEALCRLAADGALRARLVAAGLARSRRFDVRATAAAYESAYAEVATGGRGV